MGLYAELPEKSYIKQVLQGIDEAFADRFLTMLRTYKATTDPADKRLYRDKLTSMFWELYGMIAITVNPALPMAKRLFLRYGLVDLRVLTPEDQKFILGLDIEPVNYESENIYYLDEWLQGIFDGRIKASSGDETKKSNSQPVRPSNEKLDKHYSLIEVEQRRFEEFKKHRAKLFFELTTEVDLLKEDLLDEVTGYEGVFTDEQNKALDNITFYQKELKKVNKEIFNSAKTMRKAQDAIDEIKRTEEIYLETQENERLNPSLANKDSVLQEIANLRQMTKMTVGRQGNPFPFLTSGFMPKGPDVCLFKPTVKKKLNKWLALDPEAFTRTYKGEKMNIMPYMLLVPGYGMTGACWEPLDKSNKRFGKGRMVLPIFTKAPDLSLLSAMGDIRWQAAKEIASYYWMEEGLTGNYYDYYLSAKLKGDLKLLFITDYLVWMTKETQGMQKLPQEARYVFWRYVPLPDEDKITLSKKGYYYSQLWEKEQVWRRSKESY